MTFPLTQLGAESKRRRFESAHSGRYLGNRNDCYRELDPFRRLVAALKPWHGQVVIVGGWAHRLYRLHPEAQDLDYAPLITLDADVALPTRLAGGKRDIRTRLLAYGFTEDFLGDDHPPATHYRLSGEATGFYVEFLTPLVGGEVDRKHRRKATVEVAESSLNVCDTSNFSCINPVNLFRVCGHETTIQIANPVSFLTQKILIHGYRERGGKAKDILYIHDTLGVFGARLPELRELWRGVVAPNLKGRTLHKVFGAADSLFGTLSDDIRRAADIAKERRLSAETIRGACRFGLDRVFSEND